MSTSLLLPYYKTITAPLYFSAVLSTAFYGVTCMQTFYYYVHYPNDSRRMKSFVAALWIIDTVHEAVMTAGVYKHVMGCLVNPFAIAIVIPEIILQPLFVALIGVPTQSFFIYRIYVLSGKNIVIPLLWVLPAIYQLVGVLIFEAKSLYIANGSVHVVGLSVLEDTFLTDMITSGLFIAAAVDVMIAIAMTFLLLRKRNITGFASTAHVLQRLTMFSVNTGAWTAAFAVLSAVLMHVFPFNYLPVVFAIPLGSLYCNALLANLNARTYIRGEARAHNIGADLVMMSLPVSGDTKIGKECGEKKLDSSTHSNIPKTTELVAFMNGNRSTTQENRV